ncbi:MAG: type II toxin-antitoxin system VapC family toxin [Solirubrobacteraceae bacterium]
MTFFVDANVVIYSAVESPLRAPCLAILEAVARGRADGRTSTAVLEEIWHVELSGRAGVIDGLAQRAYTVFTPLLPVTDQAFRMALSLDAAQLGANDRLHVGTCLAHGIGVVLTSDRGFDEVTGIARIDPLDPAAIEGLVRSS